MCVLLSESRTLEEDGEKMDSFAMLAKGKQARGFYRITHKTLPRSRLDRSFRTYLMILDAIAHRYIPPNARVSPSALRVEPLLTS